MQSKAIYKGSLYRGDLTETQFKAGSLGTELTAFSYEVRRENGDAGSFDEWVVGDVCLSFNVGNKITGTAFLEDIKTIGAQSYTILFNDNYSDGKVDDFHHGMVITGYVYDVDEFFSEGAVLSVKIKPLSIKYLGEDDIKELHIYRGE